jgi:hypothetical protein
LYKLSPHEKRYCRNAYSSRHSIQNLPGFHLNLTKKFFGYFIKAPVEYKRPMILIQPAIKKQAAAFLFFLGGTVLSCRATSTAGKKQPALFRHAGCDYFIQM